MAHERGVLTPHSTFILSPEYVAESSSVFQRFCQQFALMPDQTIRAVILVCLS